MAKLTEVAEGSRLSTGACVAILNTCHGEQLPGDGGADDTSTTGCGD